MDAESPFITQRRERQRGLAAAGLRGYTGRAGLHFRGEDLWEGPRRYRFPALYLHADLNAPMRSLRGIVDSIALREQLSDPAVHARLRAELHASLDPSGEARTAGGTRSQQAARDDIIAGTVFDMLEQLRCEALAPQAMPGKPGIAHNLHDRFHDWTREFLQSGLSETQLGLLIFTVVNIARARILAVAVPEELEDLIEAPRYGIAKTVGPPLRQLRRLIGDQEAYGRCACDMARVVAWEARTAAEQDSSGRAAGAGARNPRFALFERDDEAGDEDLDIAALGASKTMLDSGGVYRVFTREFDQTADIAALVRPAVLGRLRRDLDAAVSEAGLSAGRLSRELLAVLGRTVDEGWLSAQEDGELDGRWLSQLVASPSAQLVFRRPAPATVVDASLTVLIDISGSMRARSTTVAAAVDVIARACALADIPVEVLGFSTRAWVGGRAAKAWKRAGSPAGAGRIAEANNIVFLSGQAGYRRARTGLGGLLRGELYREGLDGEALEWACRRALRSEAWAGSGHGDAALGQHTHHMVIVISDGSPSEAATAIANDEDYLGVHLRQVVDEWQRRPDMSIAGLGVGLDLSLYYDVHRTVDVDGEGAEALTRGLLELIQRIHRGAGR